MLSAEMNEQPLRPPQPQKPSTPPSSIPLPPATAPFPPMSTPTSAPIAPDQPPSNGDQKPLLPPIPAPSTTTYTAASDITSSATTSSFPESSSVDRSPTDSSSLALVASAADSVASTNITTTTTTTTTTATTSKIPVRPSKIRKLSSPSPSTSTAAAAPSPGAVKGGNTNRMVVRVLPRPLSADGEVAAALRHLRAVDPALAPVIDAHDPPVFQSLHPPFHSLARSILYQQLAFKAAASIYTRFLALCGGEAGVVPDTVLALTPHQLRQIGVSERKASYLYDLAHKYQTAILSDASIVAMDDKSLFTMLTMVKGIGAWSVHMFMIFSLHRPDVLPVGDLGIRKGVQLLYRLEALPRPSQMEQLCEKWKPYRSIGAWYMWRLVETKGTPTMSSAAGVGTPVGVVSPGFVGNPPALRPLALPPPPSPPQQLQTQQQQQQELLQQQQQQQPQPQPQLIPSMQGFPNLGVWGWRGL